MYYQEVVIGLCISSVLSWACLIWLFIRGHGGKRDKDRSDVTRLVHLGKDMKPLKEVSLYGRTGILIGRNTASRLVDFDMSGAEEAGEIAGEHAVLNYAGGFWYLEVLDGTGRVGIRKDGDSMVYRLKAMTHYKVNPGDLIYISHEKIAVL